jgi:hypothetical protein
MYDPYDDGVFDVAENPSAAQAEPAESPPEAPESAPDPTEPGD